MQDTGYRAIAIVGAGAVLPDAPDVSAFWRNIKEGRYSITEVTPDRWDPNLFYDADRNAPDKTYSKIGGWVREHSWDPLKWRMPIPPRVSDAMDGAQQWAVSCTREALADYGYPDRPLDTERTAVIIGNAMAGEKHYLTSMRAHFPEYARELEHTATFAGLPDAVRREIRREWHNRVGDLLPPITEDTMPGELSNCLAGRIANLYNFHGANFVCDAACASTMAAVTAAAEGLIAHDFDAVITGGVDRNMGAATFIKFCKIGALSATGSRPYAEGADGFVMGEGAALFLMKRLADAERDGDRIYAVLRGIGGSSDGKGKGITAPNPIGQKIAIERAWQNAGVSPATASLIEGHGTSTSVGDLVEVESLIGVLKEQGVNGNRTALGSVKSNIGHLKSAAAAAAFLKTALALREKVLPPSVHCDQPNPNVDFAHAPVFVNTELRPWTETRDGVRRAGISAFGFGGTNFHAVLEEYIPHRITGNGKRSVAVGETRPAGRVPSAVEASSGVVPGKAPLRGALVAGSASEALLAERLRAVHDAAVAGRTPAIAAPLESDLRAPERIAIDYGNAAELADKTGKALQALEARKPALWTALRSQGVFRGSGPARKVAFLYPGQGSQYANMMRSLRELDPIVAETFAEADRTMAPLLGKPLSEFIFVDPADSKAVAQAEEDLKQTAITQPAVLTTDLALTRMLEAYGICPDMTMGHSLGEYAALVAAKALPFADALEAVSARGREMTRVSVADNGRMAAVMAPLDEIERILQSVDGYVVVANYNSKKQAVIGGASAAVAAALAAFQKAGFEAVPLHVSHAFHTSIVAPASEPLMRTLQRLNLQAPQVPVVANLDAAFYPMNGDARPAMLQILARQVASPVQFIKGLQTLYDAGARVFVEVGPKKALFGFAGDVLAERGEILALFTNHPKFGDSVAFNQALCGLYAAGLGNGRVESRETVEVRPAGHSNVAKPVVISGASLGLPGTERVFDDGNVARILKGEQFIDVIPTRFRRAILDKHITRLTKTDNGGPVFEEIRQPADVIKLAARGGAFDLQTEFGIPAERVSAFDRSTMLAIGAGLDALRDAGIPLTMRYKTTTTGTRLPDRWGLPDALRDDTGVIFACVFPGLDSFAGEIGRYHEDRTRREQLAMLEDLAARAGADPRLRPELDRRIAGLKDTLARSAYNFDRRFLFHVLSMGHSQFAEWIGARGPNSQVNAACASTTQAVAVAEDWIRAGRCRRVIVISSDDITSDNLIEWFGAGFLASGAAATDDVVEDAAIPFDRRRHGMIIGMGAAALVVESAEAAAERGLEPICEVLGAVTSNSAFHGTRLDVSHIRQVMETLVAQAERNSGIGRAELASSMVFVSHETYTPARGGSASAEINALRSVFGEAAGRIVIANTKGFTGHAMGTGIEDVVAVKALETGCVPPVANFKEVDPELGPLNLSRGGAYPVQYALRLGAGFGSQISMTLMRRAATAEPRPAPNALGYQNRIADRALWQQWLDGIAGHPANLEVVQRTLRVHDSAAIAVAAPVETAAATPAPPRAAAPPAAAAPAAPAPVAAPPQKPAAAPPQAVAAPVALAPVAVSTPDPVKEKLLQLVTEKTGYPKDMLDLDLDLEADLGVDTVKQAELFSAIREIYGIERDPNLKLRDFPTLARAIQFVYDRRPDLKAAAPAAPAPVAASNPDLVKEKLLQLVTEKTGYPKDMLDLDLDLEADLGVDTVKQAELFSAIREIYGIERDPNLKLRDFPTLARVIQFVYDRRPDLQAAAPVPATPAAPATAAVPPQAPATSPIFAATPAAPAPVAGSTPDPVKEKLLQLVTEKTGYPKDMLDLDLDLEADLGVDTVKQAELFAAIRQIYSIERDPNLKLRDFPTLARVIQFVYERRPDLKATASPSAPLDSIREKVLDMFAEKTGYPKEMLDPDLDLEADLGIDTVKQAELFAAIRAAFDIPRDQALKLRDFPTLGHVIRFAREGMGKAAEPATPPVVAEEQRPAPASFGASEAIPRRVPVPVLRPALDACKPSGVVLGPGQRVLLVPDRGGVADNLAAQLRERGVEVVAPDDTPSAIGSVNGVYWLPALDDEGDIHAVSIEDWSTAVDVRVKSLYRTMQSLYEQVASPGTFLVSATRLGGQHGYGEYGAHAPLGGAVAGFTKAYKRERPEVLVKVVDFEREGSADAVAQALVAETLRDPGAVEIGYADGLRWTVGLEPRSLDGGGKGQTLGRDTVFVVTGAAGSIVSAITADLAAASGGTFYLLDLIPEPDPSNPDLRRFEADKDGLKRDLFARIQARGERATPAMVERELAAIERARAAQSAMDAVRAAGGVAHYYAVNMTDGEAVAKAVSEIRNRSGHIDVLLHAAGIERSHPLPAKEPREFDLVFDVKSAGCFHLLRAIGDMPLGNFVAFSSIAGRFGNAGQTDYSAANDFLCKLVSNFRRTRPATRGFAIDWTAWGGIGMATRGSIPKVMEAAGIDMLPPAAGIPWIRRELTSAASGGEIVVAGSLGLFLKEFDATGGFEETEDGRGPMAGNARIEVDGGLTVEGRLDPAIQPFLHDHAIEGTPVLPGVMGIEAFAEAASLAAPGWEIESIEDVDFQAPFKFYRGEPRTVTVQAKLHPEADRILARCELIGRRNIAGQTAPQTVTHFTGHVRLARQIAEPRGASLVPRLDGLPIERRDIYRVYFHGPAYQVLKKAWCGADFAVGELSEDLPDNHHPAGEPLTLAPRLIELCFQTAGLWEMVERHRMGLPRHVDVVTAFGSPCAAPGPVYAVVTPDSAGESFDAEVVDGAGNCCLRLRGYRTVAFKENVETAFAAAATAAG